MFYATEGLEIIGFTTKAVRAKFVLAKKLRAVDHSPVCGECANALVEQEDSLYTDREFYYVCVNGHTCHNDGKVCSEQHLAERDAARYFYDKEDDE